MNGFIINTENYLGRAPDGADESELYGVLEDGRYFIWRLSPSCRQAFLPSQVELPAENYHEKLPDVYHDQYRRPLRGYTFTSIARLRELEKDRRKDHFLEADLPAVTQLLALKNIKGSVYFESPPQEESASHALYINPQIRPASYVPELRSISIDIETGVPNGKLYSIALYNEDIQTVLMLDPQKTIPAHAGDGHGLAIESSPNESHLLQRFLELMQEINPHIIMGWNIVGFDFNFLMRKCQDLQLPFTVGIHGLAATGYKRKSREVIICVPGRAFLEGMDIVKLLAPPLPNYKLDTAAEVLLGEGKTISLTGTEKIKEINRLFARDKIKLAIYNLKDTSLVYDLMKRFDALSFQLHRSRLTGVPMERLRYPSEITERALLPLMRHKHVVFQTSLAEGVPLLDDTGEQETVPAHMSGPLSCITIQNILPLTILYYKIDPYGIVAAQQDGAHAIHTATGSSFHQTQHFLPFLIETLLQIQKNIPPTEKTASLTLSTVLHQTITGLTVSSSRFARSNLHKALHEAACHLIKGIVKGLEDAGAHVVFYDTYVLLVAKKEPSSKLEDHNDFITTLLEHARKEILPQIFKSIGHLPALHVANVYKRIFIPEQPFTVLRDRSALNYHALDEKNHYKRQSREYHQLKILLKTEEVILKAALETQNIEETIQNFKKELIAGDYDDLLVYRKKVTRSLEGLQEKAHLPPHLEAALQIPAIVNEAKLEVKRPYVFYVITEQGGEPADKRKHPPRYEHYWQKEIAPLIKRLFTGIPLEKDIDMLTIAEDRELSLF